MENDVLKERVTEVERDVQVRMNDLVKLSEARGEKLQKKEQENRDITNALHLKSIEAIRLSQTPLSACAVKAALAENSFDQDS